MTRKTETYRNKMRILQVPTAIQRCKKKHTKMEQAMCTQNKKK
jgi:hypothetical protein